jgi:hypothetical protein
VFATLVVALVSLALFVASSFLGSVGNVLSAAISAIGLQIAIYYGLAGLAVVLAYRKVVFRSLANFVFIGAWPLLGAVFMFWVFGESIPDLSATSKVVGLGALALGIIPMAWYWTKGVAYYRTRPLDTFVTADDEPAAGAPPVTDPDADPEPALAH